MYSYTTSMSLNTYSFYNPFATPLSPGWTLTTSPGWTLTTPANWKPKLSKTKLKRKRRKTVAGWYNQMMQLRGTALKELLIIFNGGYKGVAGMVVDYVLLHPGEAGLNVIRFEGALTTITGNLRCCNWKAEKPVHSPVTDDVRWFCRRCGRFWCIKCWHGLLGANLDCRVIDFSSVISSQICEECEKQPSLAGG